VTSPENYNICFKYRVYGVDERYKVTVEKHLEPGDMVIFYIKEKKVFRGPWRVVNKGTYNPKHEAVNKWKPSGKFIYVIPIEPANNLGECSLTNIFNDLLFLTNRKKGKGGYSDHFQFSIISIREEDFNTIINHMSI